MSKNIKKNCPIDSLESNLIEWDFGDNITVVSENNKGKWSTTIVYKGTYRIDGIAESASILDGILTVGINDVRRHLVFRYDKYGECDINRVSEIVMPHHPITFYVSPRDRNRIMVKHRAIGQILPIVDEIVFVEGIVFFHMGSVMELYHIDNEMGESDSSRCMGKLYRVGVNVKKKTMEIYDAINDKVVCINELNKEDV